MKSIVILLSITCVLSAQSQIIQAGAGVSFANTSSYDKDGAQFNMNGISTITSTSSTSSYEGEGSINQKFITGWNAEASIFWKLRERVAFGFGIQALTKGYHSIHKQKEEYISPFSESRSNYTYEYKETYTYLDIPIGLKLELFRTNQFSIYGNGGLFVGFALTGNYYIKNEQRSYYAEGAVVWNDEYTIQEETGSINISGETPDIPLGEENWGMNTGLFGGIGFQYSNFFLQGNYGFGWANFDPKNKDVYMRNNINITFGYSFDLGAK